MPRLEIFASILILLSACSMNKMIDKETEEILAAAQSSDDRLLSEQDFAELPLSVQRWIQTTGIIGKPVIRNGRAEQDALMKMKPEQKKWHRAKAVQYFTTEPPAFIWTVRMSMSPIIRIRGRDKFVAGKGEMLIRMNSLINVVNEKGEKLDEGTIQRYLGEIVWYPSAVLSPYISWEEIDGFSAKATMSYKGTTGSGTFFFNEEGDFVKFSALRYMGNEPDAERYEWIITVDEYAVFEGIKVPAKMQAIWKLPEEDWTWLQLEVQDISYNLNF